MFPALASDNSHLLRRREPPVAARRPLAVRWRPPAWNSFHCSNHSIDSDGVRFLHFTILIAMLTLLVYVVNRDRLASRRVSFKAAEPANRADLPANDEDRKTDWSTLRQFDHRTGGATPAIRTLHGRRVAVPGFVVPLEDDSARVREFLLVPYFGACVHTPPPPPNQMVLVQMANGREILMPFEPVWVHGVLRIAERNSPFGKAAFELTGDRVEIYRE